MKNKSIEVGDKIPSFSLLNQYGEQVSIDRFLGKPFVIYFYPKDDTPGCTAEACQFRDAYADLRDLDAEVVGISSDDPASHLAFAEKFNLPFVLLSDLDNEVRKHFNVPGSFFGFLPGRVTYVIDADGIVRHMIRSQIDIKRHIRETIRQLKELPA